jgi:hypothetical protein
VAVPPDRHTLLSLIGRAEYNLALSRLPKPSLLLPAGPPKSHPLEKRWQSLRVHSPASRRYDNDGKIVHTFYKPSTERLAKLG